MPEFSATLVPYTQIRKDTSCQWFKKSSAHDGPFFPQRKEVTLGKNLIRNDDEKGIS